MKNYIKKPIWFKPTVHIPVLVILLAVVSYFLFSGPGTHTDMSRESQGLNDLKSKKAEKGQIWTCSMHPHIQKPGPGQCPICGMTLIPVDKGGETDDEDPNNYTMSENSRKLAKIVTAPVKRKFVTTSVRMVGKIDFDETRIGNITAWIPGRIDKLYVDYTGVTVKKGDHMAYIYSPELLAGQEELIQAVKSVKEAKRSSHFMRKSAIATLKASRDKLRLWGLTQKQIKAIEKRGKPSDNLTIYAPMGGVVIHKNGIEGMYVKTGTKIYTIADLSHLWVQLDAYESDLMWIRYGQHMEFTTEAYPGEIFHGQISFIDPVLNARTRTIKVRVNVENPDGKLKPEMLVHATVHSKVSTDGKVMDESLADKWICPMHPEVIENHKGSCPICGMSMLSTKSLGFVKPDMRQTPIVVPATAVLMTGKRAVVYVELPDKKRPTYQGREIVLGPRADDYYIVRSGLSEGEMVVTNGNFKIDSALQIQAKPSMMYPAGGAPVSGHAHHGGKKMNMNKNKKMNMKDQNKNDHSNHNKGSREKTPAAFIKQVSDLFTPYLTIQESLAADDVKGAAKGAGEMTISLSKVDMTQLTGSGHMDWMDIEKSLKKSIKEIKLAPDIKEQRTAFAQVTTDLLEINSRFGFIGRKPLFRFQCPMALGKGAPWIQRGEKTKNPYYGSSMIGCGNKTGKIGD